MSIHDFDQGMAAMRDTGAQVARFYTSAIEHGVPADHALHLAIAMVCQIMETARQQQARAEAREHES